jgi:hypothetical protein
MLRVLVSMNGFTNRRAQRSASPGATSISRLGLTQRPRLAAPSHPDASIEP